MGDVLRILDRFRITGRGVVYTVKISKGCIIHIGDVLLDLRGNRFEVSGIEMFRGIIAEGKSFEDMPLGLMFKQLDGVEAYGNILVKDLNDINFIFCNHPLYQRKVDEDYEVEYQEAGLHHSCALFSYEDMERGKLSLFGEEISGLTIYRGWMMKPEMYSDFYTLLEQKGIYLINTPEEYERYHTLPGWYDDFADETAQSVWETEGNVENALLKAKQLSGSYIVKDYVKSRKHEWYDACFISNIADVANTARRALLCKGDYTLFHSSNSSFLIDNDRDISWKRLLRIQSNEKNGTYQNRRKMFFSLIKDPLFDQNDIADSLQKICDRDVAGITDWRKYFITVPEIMDSLHKYTDGRASERYVRFEGKYIFLMGSTRLYGWNEEYYSYALYCLLKKLPNASVKYNQAKGWEDVDCHIELTSSTNAGKWKIKYLRAKDKFSVIDASGVQSLYSTVEDAKYALEKLL